MPLCITLVGTGALACLFGAKLAKLAPVTLVGTWAEGLAALENRGIWLEAAGAISTTRVSAAHWACPPPPADLVLVLVKAWQTARVAAHLPALLKPAGVAVTLQNGLGNREILGGRTCQGITTLGATLLGPGHVRLGGTGPTHLATPAWVAETFSQAGFETQAVEAGQMDSLVWGKLAVNCGINALTALLRVPNGELLRRPEAALQMEQAATECAAVAQAHNISLPYADPAARVREVAQCTAANFSSMLQDVLRGAPTEIDAINGAVMRAGQRLGVPTPVNEALFSSISNLNPLCRL
jgi:2-dehydropantoate 2-reductase